MELRVLLFVHLVSLLALQAMPAQGSATDRPKSNKVCG